MNPTEVHGACGVVLARVVQGTRTLHEQETPRLNIRSRPYHHTCNMRHVREDDFVCPVGRASHAYGGYVQVEAACTCLATLGGGVLVSSKTRQWRD